MKREFWIIPLVDGKPAINISIQTDNHSADFNIVWHSILNTLVPRLEMFDDCWHVLYFNCQDLLIALAKLDNQNVSIERMAVILKDLGYEDKTK